MTNDTGASKPCPLCGGQLMARLATIPFVVGKTITVIEHVPAEVCESCREPFLPGEATDAVTSLLESSVELSRGATAMAAGRKARRIDGMAQPKHKVSLSLPPDLVAWIDRQVARKRGGTRSGVVEQAVRDWARRAAAKDIEDATVAYYQAMTSAEKEEDDEWSRLGGSTWRSNKD